MRFYHDKAGLQEAPYLLRWIADFGLFSIRLYKWLGSDDPRAFHDHGQWFITCCLWGGYNDITIEGCDPLSAGSIRFRKATHTHTVQLRHQPTWTLLLFGPPKRRWYFYLPDGKRKPRDKYFAENGHHRMDGGEPIRISPDRKRI